MLNFLKKRKLKYSFYGNCQIDAICDQLNASEEFTRLYEYVPIKPVHLLVKDDLKNIEKDFSQIDLLIYQEVGSNFKNGPDFASNHVLTFLKKNSQKICIPSLFFNAYFPDFHEIITNDQGPLITPLMGAYHDLNIALAYVYGFKSGDFVKMYNNKNFYDKKYCQKLLDNAIFSLEEREINNRVDVRISDFIRKNYQKQKLFNSQNHPKPVLLQYVIDNMILKLGLNFQIHVKETKLDILESPVHPSIYQNLNLKFINKMDFLTFKGIVSGYKNITELFYEEYKKIDKTVLLNSLTGLDYELDRLKNHLSIYK